MPKMPPKLSSIVEQILKDFLSYLYGVKKKFKEFSGEEGDGGPDWGKTAILDNRSYHPPQHYLPWTHSEAHKHKDHLKYYGRALGDQMHRIPKDNKIVKGILESIKSSIREGIQGGGPYFHLHVSFLVASVSKLLHIVQPVDLEKLIELMKHNRQAGDSMDGKDVILLLGSVGSGKTTTLQFLSGTSFTEVEVDGFFHLQPTGFTDPSVEGYETSCGREAVTKSIQTAQVNLDGANVVLCDTPGFGEDEGVEENIANGLGIVRALHRARSVRPVLILSREGMGDRFSAFSETLSSVTRLIGNAESVDLRPFNYVFTKYEQRHRSCMCRQFILIRKRPRAEEEGKVMFKAFVEDIIQKTTPEANIALPMENNRRSLLRGLLKDDLKVSDPRVYFVPFVSDSALRKLKLQLQITLRDIMTALVEEDYGLAAYRMEQLSNLATVLPEAGECAQLGLEASLRHIGVTRGRICQISEKLQVVKIHKQFTQLLGSLRLEIKKVIAEETLRRICEDFETNFRVEKKKAPLASEIFCFQQVQKLLQFVNQDIPEFDPAFLNTEALMRRRGSFLTGVVRLKEMSEIVVGIPGDRVVVSTYKRAFHRFYTFVDCVLSEAERNFHTSPKDLHGFERQAWFLAVLIQGFLNKPNTGSGEHIKMEDLENRRLKLMLRLEIKISDTMELIENTKFPDGGEEEPKPDCLPLVKLSGLRGPRQLLLCVSQLPRLCKFLPSKIDKSEVEKTIAMLDKKITAFLGRTVNKAESIFNRLDGTRSEKDITAAIEGAITMRRDLQTVISEFSVVRRWSDEIEEATEDHWNRILIVQEAVEESIITMEESLASQGLGFSCGVLPSSYLCSKPNDNSK